MQKDASKSVWSLYQAASTLSIIYVLRGDTNNSQRYFEQAVSNGQNAQDLRAAIDRKLDEQKEIAQYERDLSGEKQAFHGDIIITDPSYIIADNEDWETCEYGKKLDALGIKTYLTFEHGDSVGTTVINTDTDEVLGEFAGDSCMVSVILLSDLLTEQQHRRSHRGAVCIIMLPI